MSIIDGTIPKSVLTSFTENEKGWLVGEGIDTKRISVIVDAEASEKLQIHMDGAMVEDRGGTLYAVWEDGTELSVGNTYDLGNDKKEYYLNDGQYEFEFTATELFDSEKELTKMDTISLSNSLTIEYSDAGYSQRAIKYEQVPVDAMLVVKDFNEMETECFVRAAESEIYQPGDDDFVLLAPSAVQQGEMFADYE